MSRAEAADWAAEYNALSARWEVLSARLTAEGESVLIRQRLERVEALMDALMGDVGALSR